MKTRFLVVFLFLNVAYAQLELEPVNLLKDFSDLLRSACGLIGNGEEVLQTIPLGQAVPEELSWMCATLPAIERAANLAQGFLGDVNGFISQTMSDSFSRLGDAVGWQLGGVDVLAIVDEALNNLEDGVFSAKGIAGRVLSRINQALYQELTDSTPPDANEAEGRLAAVLEQTPSRIMQELQGAQVREDNILRTAESVDVVNQAKTLAATSVARGDEEQLLLRVTHPGHAAGGAGGTADEAEDLGFAAVSSRAAIQALVGAQADFMRQQAVSSANITAALKEHAVQQTLTTQQLGILIQSVSEQNLLEYEKWEAEYYDQVVEASAEAKAIEDNYAAVAALISDAP